VAATVSGIPRFTAAGTSGALGSSATLAKTGGAVAHFLEGIVALGAGAQGIAERLEERRHALDVHRFVK